MSDKASSKAILNEVLSLADSNWVLGHWHMINLLNSRSLQDATSLAAMAQDALGHTRAALLWLEDKYEFQEMQLEFKRSIDQVHGMRVLDRAPQSWTDFVVTLLLSEHALWAMMNTFKKSSVPELGAMLEAFGQESQFHRLNYLGWFKAFSDEERAEVADVLESRLPLAIEWFGSEAASNNDPLLKDGVRSSSVWQARARFLEEITQKLDLSQEQVQAAVEASVATDCDNARRRPDGIDIPAAMWEHMVPTNEGAVACRRTLAVSITDELDLYDRPNSRNWDFEPIPLHY